MHKAIRLMALALFTAPLFLAAQTSNVTLPQDKGPDKIDVSAYPPEQQKAYKVFDRQVLQVPHHRAAHQHDHDQARSGSAM